jgi:mono/diheme cytochrome c family protein
MRTLKRFAGFVGIAGAASLAPAPAPAQQVTYSRDIAPILQRSCERCHRPNSLAPMSLRTYQEARRYAARIKERTQLRHRPGVMPPWFVERNVGIQHFANDESLSEQEIALIAAWVDAGAPEGDPADLPKPLVWPDEPAWDIGEPDLVVDLPSFTMEANAPDWWGMIEAVPTGLTEDRYVAAMQVLEISDVEGGVGGKFIFHHAILTSTVPGGRGGGPFWPVHEVGRNAQWFDPDASPLLRAGSEFFISSAHLHANDRRTTAHLRLGFKFHPRGYVPKKQETMLTFGNGEIDLAPMRKGQVVHAYHVLEQHMKITSFEPHMHASGVRMCLDAIWGGRTETINCVGYDHNWVKVYSYHPDYAPLLPAGTLVRITAYFDTTSDNRNVVDPRNWQGLGHRSIDNMAITFLPGIALTDEEFAAEIARRRAVHGLAEGEAMIGCPLCGYANPPLARERGRAP